MSQKPATPARFVAETRLSMGRQEFEVWLAGQVDAETRVALYNRDPQGREIAAGRAQVWLELQNLFAKP
jgi:hypothetical protein